MKNKKEINVIKQEIENVSKKPLELNEDELDQVTGGGNILSEFSKEKTGETKKGDNPPNCCFKPGTKITMADGSNKKIEDIKLGEYVKTYNLTTKTVNNSKVIGMTSEKVVKPEVFTLFFTNDIELTIVSKHCLYEREKDGYVMLSKTNANDYIGHYFYNVNDNRYEKLLSVKIESEPAEPRFIVTENYYNSVSNNMLSIPYEYLQRL